MKVDDKPWKFLIVLVLIISVITLTLVVVSSLRSTSKAEEETGRNMIFVYTANSYSGSTLKNFFE